MARKSSGNGKTGPSSSWKDRVHFVNLSYNQEVDVKAWVAQVNTPPYTLLEELLDEGYAVKISPTEEGNVYFGTVQCKIAGAKLEGHSWTFRYASVVGVVYLCAWFVLSWGRANDLSAPGDESVPDFLGLE